MDTALPVTEIRADGSIESYFERTMVIPNRILDMNICEGREKLWSMWEEKRRTLLSDDELYMWIMDLEEWINASGAYLRESEKWYGYAEPLNLSELLYYEQQHMNTIEWNMNEYWPLEQ